MGSVTVYSWLYFNFKSILPVIHACVAEKIGSVYVNVGVSESLMKGERSQKSYLLSNENLIKFGSTLLPENVQTENNK